MKKLIALLCLLFGFSSSAFSYTDCTTTISNIYVGDGTVYIIYTGGGGMSIPSSNSDQKNAYAAAMAAMLMGKTVTVRAVASGVSCADVRGDFQGIYITN
jgi:hypothetical protein